jgi:uncharacterized protein (DUF58 family)
MGSALSAGWRGTLRKWILPRRRFPPTREGWYFLVATLLVGLGAINAGLNLLFLLWGMMLFLILASGVLSELCLRRLIPRRTPPSSITAGTPYLMGIALANRKRRLPSFSIEVEDLVDGKPIEKRCYFLKLPAGRTQETAYRHTVERRGRLHLTGYRLSTRFPFGLIHKSRDVPEPMELLVYPALCPVPADLISGLASRHGVGQHKRRSRRGEFHGLREFRKGDDPRDIHWRTSARRGAPFVRETEDDEGQDVWLVFDNAPSPVHVEDPSPRDRSGPVTGVGAGAGAGGAGAPASGGMRTAADRPTAGHGVDGRAAFEHAVSLTASLACALIGRGYRVGLAVRGGTLVPEGGPAQVARLLRHLALIAPAAPEAPPPEKRRGGAHIVLVAGQAPQVRVEEHAGSTGEPPRRSA